MSDMSERRFNPGERQYFRIGKDGAMKNMSETEYIAAQIREGADQRAETPVEPAREAEKDPIERAFEERIKKVAWALQGAVMHLRHVKHDSKVGEATVNIPPGKVAEVAQEVAAKFAEQKLALEAEVNKLRGLLKSLQDGLEAFRQSKELV
jgi:hypothetical protein